MKSYFKFLSRNKLYTIIEALGLIISLAFVILIGSYVVQQYSVIKETPESDRIYMLGTDNFISLGFWDKEAIDPAVPEIEISTRIMHPDECLLEVTDNKINCNYTEVDPEFFEIFPNHAPIEGSVSSFIDPSNIFVSRSIANRISKNGESVIGKAIKISNIYDENSDDDFFIISGIFEDIENSLILPTDCFININNNPEAKYFLSQQDMNQPNRGKYQSAGSTLTIFRLVKGADKNSMINKVIDICNKNYDNKFIKAKVFSLEEVFFNDKSNYHLRHSNKSLLNILSIVVLLLLFSAIINYINLTFALAGKRAKEMATRRLLGAGKNNIFLRFIFESLIFTGICFTIALIVAQALVPMMNSLLIGQDPAYFIPIKINFSVKYIFYYIVSILILGTICGLAPAFFLLQFSPIDIVRGSFRSRNKMVFSNIFIVLQNVLAVILISIAILMEIQMKHMLRRPLNTNTDNLYFLQLGEEKVKDLQLFEDKLKALPCVKRIGYGSHIPGNIGILFSTQALNQRDINLSMIVCDSNYFNMFGFKKIEDYGYPLINSIWIGETTSKALGGIRDSTEAMFTNSFTFNNSLCDKVGGVVTDIPTSSATNTYQNPYWAVLIDNIDNLRYNCNPLIETTDESKETLLAINNAYKEYSIEKFGTEKQPYLSGFIRDINKFKLSEVNKTKRLLELFMVLAVLLSALGLFAMSTYFANESSKDIAIRKVFGGTVISETLRYVKLYMYLIIIACIIGLPISIWACRRYLEQFSYRVENYWWIFIVAILITLLIAFLSVVWQVHKVTKTNPANVLKKE
ncbi:MAG: ABC transporter permease [Bacteroidales bacterium]|jgi:putative ABC transport system permease protein